MALGCADTLKFRKSITTCFSSLEVESVRVDDEGRGMGWQQDPWLMLIRKDSVRRESSTGFAAHVSRVTAGSQLMMTMASSSNRAMRLY